VRQLAASGRREAALAAVTRAVQEGFAHVEHELTAVVQVELRHRETARLRDQARVAARESRWEVARDALVEAVRVDDSEAETWIMLADALRWLGDPSGAMAAVDRALALGDSAERRTAEILKRALLAEPGSRR
jgi:cytochrome c-type biogenesis protein CcmH/NrfG